MCRHVYRHRDRQRLLAAATIVPPASTHEAQSTGGRQMPVPFKQYSFAIDSPSTLRQLLDRALDQQEQIAQRKNPSEA